MGSSFAAQFMRGLQAGTEEKRRKAEEEAARGQRELGNQITGRNLALQDLELAKSMPAPVEQLPAGVQGPPQTLEQLITIPGVRALGIGDKQVRPTYQTDINIQQRAQEDLKQGNALERLAAELGLREESTARGEQRAQEAGALTISTQDEANFYGRPIGAKVSKVEREAAQAVRSDDRQRDLARDAREGRAGDRAAVAAEKRTAMDVAVDAYVDAAREGRITREALSSAGKDVATRVQTKLAKDGIKLLSAKENEYKAELDDLASLAAQTKELFQPGYVGALDSRFPDALVSDPRLAEFRRNNASMFNQFAKARSGAAVSMPEEVRLKTELPAPGDNEVVYQAKLNALIKEIDAKRSRLLGQKSQGSGAAPGGKAPKAAPLIVGAYEIVEE